MEDYTPVDEDFPGRLLHQAALWDNAELLEDLLRGEHIQYINNQDSWGRTPLHAAAITENSRCLEVLLANGANPNTPCGPRGQYRTPLHVSTEHGHSENIKKLLEYHVDIQVHDNNNQTALDIAEKKQDENCIKLLKIAVEKYELARLASHTALRTACMQGDFLLAKNIIQSTSNYLDCIINMSPDGANTLLFIASEMGYKDIVKLLLENSADCRSHPVTKYGPLYIACYNGKLEIVDLLLRHNSKQVQYLTVEKWLPIHAATINSHLPIIDILLKYDYPQKLCKKFKDLTGEFEYDMAFDVNMQDINGQNILYIASMLGNVKIVDYLLSYRVKARKINEEESSSTNYQPLPIAKRRISSGIQRLMSSLNFRCKGTDNRKDENTTSPFNFDIYCNNNNNNCIETALHAAVKAGHTDVVISLVQAGANTNLQIKNIQPDSDINNLTVLTIACQNCNIKIVDILLKYGAVDNDCKALKIAAKNRDELLTAKLLSIKAHPDSEYKIHKKAMTESTQTSHFSALSSFGNVTYPSLFPNTPTMINWHDQQCRLSQIRTQWLIDAVLHVNKKLSSKNNDLALFAITRLDISLNSITNIPSIIFYLQSLRYLNIAQNKIDNLNADNKNIKDKLCPVLEEFYLQDNRLEKLPEFIMNMPSLEIMDVSNNKLQCLPDNLWRSPKLKELNASFNLLRDLPSQVSQNITRKPPQRDDILTTNQKLKIRDDSMEFDSFTKLTNAEIIEMERPHVWTESVRVTEKITDDTEPGTRSVLSSLNLAHNLFTSVPVALPCLAVSLARLNMAYNSLRSMSHITSYPASLKQLDLSNNQISCWPSLPQVDGAADSMEQATTACYCPSTNIQSPMMASSNRQTATSLRDIVLMSVCTHRRHLRLENLRTLVLANNLLTRIQLTSIDDGENSSIEEETIDRDTKITYSGSKLYLLFPNVSMLDVSNNSLKEIPHNINELSNLSVLNISGNADISELPPQMGLLSRLWNLNTQGCRLQEPLKSMIESKKYKTMDVIGYLKSILEDAKPYARMKLMIVGIQGIGKTSLLEQLRQEGDVPSKKKSSEHWAKRMGNKNINSKTARGTIISTVGVDIGDWIYEKKVRGQSSHGSVYFRTWDFGGQKEYYATHQYFLSKRSLYIVVWRITDGYKGVSEIFQWLVNIQSRAPNSPVIIVGTHYDVSNEQSEVLQQYIRDKFINIVDAEKCGLPKVMETIEVSCKTRHNIKMLCNLIYDVVFSLRSSGSKELLLEQRVPASYLALEDVVVQLAHDRKLSGADPVLKADQYYAAVNNELQKLHRSFRDPAELHQATLFLHENGIILHYDDATLKDLYFLDPQWLCDMLAHVVTIREINPFARSGIMKLDDIQHVFKSSTISTLDTQGYIVSLLNKFEVALTWDYRTLLIPSLLPTEEDILRNNQLIRIPLKSRSWHVRTKKITSPISINPNDTKPNQCSLTSRPQPDCSVTRLLLMSYFPSGFWSRLITRILADDAIVDIVMSFITPFKDFVDDNIFASLLDINAEWIVWQTGLELRYAGITLLRLKEVNYKLENSPYDYRNLKFKLKQDGIWCSVDIKNSAILEIWFPVDTLVIKQPILSDSGEDEDEDDEPMGYQAIVVEPRPESMPQLLALIVDHIDILLEDWYPTLGTRFVHTSEGKLLVTRLIPCPRCLLNTSNNSGSHEQEDTFSDYENSKTSDDMQRVCLNNERQSQDSYKSDVDSGVGYDSSTSSRIPSLEGHPNVNNHQKLSEGTVAYSWMVEECILSAYSNKTIACPKHMDIPLSHVAPDIVFMDLGIKHLIKSDDIKRGKMLGRGAFGFVFKGICKLPGTNLNKIEVAMKMLQPVPPGPNSRPSAVLAYKAAQSKWDRDPLQYACKAYCTARQELNILLTLRHTNIVPLVGIVISPLALVLDLAPEGALDNVLKNYRRSGAKLDSFTLQAIILQVAKAVEYLHQQHVIYRDLKSENVLVWQIPQPFQGNRDFIEHAVHVKVADYGISRLTLPSGAKGFGGTEGFMAPEIIKYNGEEEYTEKVDSFSFGMFIYELITLRQPFEGHEAVKECILEGGRPPLTYRETQYPCYILDLMVICWAQNPKDRPNASQIVSIASAPEFTHLIDVTVLTEHTHVTAITATSRLFDDNIFGDEIWLGHNNGEVDMLLCTDKNWLQHVRIETPVVPYAMCGVDGYIWIGDNTGQIHIYLGSNFGCVGSYNLENDHYCESKVIGLIHIEQIKQFVVALHSGKIYLLTNNFTNLRKTEIDTNIIDNNIKTYSLAVVFRKRKIIELWTGQSFGRIKIYIIKDNGNLIDTCELVHVKNELTSKNLFATYLLAADNSVLTYTYPGCIVYQWDVETRTIINKLDMSKLVPCSESLKSISIEENLTTERCQVTALEACNNQLYIGTTWGCIAIAECDSLRPVTVFRPFEGKVSQIVAFRSQDKKRLSLVTVGQGYRSLISRYTDYPLDCLVAEDLKHNMYSLLWRSEHWS